MRIGFVHTASVLIERFRADMTRLYPEVDCFHVLNEGLMQSLRRGESRAQVFRRAVTQLLIAADDSADIVVLTCCSTAPAAEIARSMSPIPILNVADAASAEAVRLGRRIGLLCTSPTSPGPSAGLLRQHAAAQGREVIVETVVRSEAFTALFAGDKERHDAILTEAAQEILPRVDVLVLAQATLAHLQAPLSRLGKPVLASPPMLLAELGRRLAPVPHAV